MLRDRIHQAYDGLCAKVHELSSWTLVAIASFTVVALVVIDGALATPIIDRSHYLYKYLSATDSQGPQLSAESLDGEIRSTLDRVLPPSWSGRVLYQRVDRWAPIPLDNAGTRSENLRKVADISPLASFSYVESGASVLSGYRTLLSELRQDAYIRAKFEKSADSSLVERIERQVFSLGQGSLSVTEIDAARQRIESFDVPNPETQFSPHPPVTFGQCDLESWLQSTPRNPTRHRLSFVEMQISPGDISASSSTLTGSATSGESAATSFPAFTGALQTTISASDWRVCVIRRPWLEESILDRLRNNVDPFVNTRDLFGTGGALAVVPFAIVVAKDVTVEVVFSDRSSFENVKKSVARGQSVQIQRGGSRLVVEGDIAGFDETRNSVVIPVVSGNAQVMFVVSKLY